MLCYSVKLVEYYRISPKATKIFSYDGGKLIIPTSCMLKPDPRADNAYWIAAWILDKNRGKFQFSDKIKGWFDPRKRDVRQYIEIEIHEPEYVAPVKDNTIDELKRID